MLLSFKDSDLIKIVTGVRRCGKSTLLELYQKELMAQGINADIWTGADYLNRGETLYYVKWNLD